MFEPQLKIETDGRLSKPPLDYFRLFYADTSVYTVGSIDCAREFLGADHVLFGTDAPFDATGGRSSVRESVAAIRNSSCTEREKANIFSGNVRRFFRLERAGHENGAAV
jgi:aminocarboxymuconate-semialdehyde decarboxylase